MERCSTSSSRAMPLRWTMRRHLVRVFVLYGADWAIFGVLLCAALTNSDAFCRLA